ncbi:uncharacterized protein PITG_07779 [Phytophthora infestans T30-4]|uniref:Uncharacterized protein n=1 Tax=Phytophthora infestans (strain T30-4) TaxID=403677 RepID=D0N930_PHYIT|nr:uncharacterized protein PITG_07779 [Phytophthora infestans T30-4]EEY54065.1 conserved hypothetical protein [Phytophthora infestans T30-4]|eukprot:XP_002904696.1 conserved hypothetical protein [Phytophthora infestans T30-4]
MAVLLRFLQRVGASLEKLSIQTAYYNAPVSVITGFAKKLGDPSSALANSIRELHLSADNDVSPMTEASLQTFLNVLKINDKLELLEMRVLPEIADRYAAAFRRHHRETLSVEEEKLPLPCRLAFLSVVRGCYAL